MAQQKPQVRREEKTTAKTTEAVPVVVEALEVGALVQQPHGGALRNGGTNKGGPGRPTNEFKDRMRRLADRATQALEVSTILDDPTNPLYLPAAKWASEHGYGRPVASIEMHSVSVIRVVVVDE